MDNAKISTGAAPASADNPSRESKAKELFEASRQSLPRPEMEWADLSADARQYWIDRVAADNPSTAGAVSHDWLFRSRVADLIHLLPVMFEFQEGDRATGAAALANVRKMLTALVAQSTAGAVTEAMIEAALNEFNSFPCPMNGSVARGVSQEQMRAGLLAAINAGQSTAGAAKGGITNEYVQYVMKLEAHALCLLDAATVYAFAYMQDEADDAGDCVCGEEQHERAKAVFAAIKSLDKVLAAPAPHAQPEPAAQVQAELNDRAIDEVWNSMPGGADGWLKQFGYRQFARAIARHVLVRVAASMAGAIRPTDDELWEQTIGERDHYHDMADKLADAIAKHFCVEIGEHSNMNCPWHEALDAIESSAAKVPTAAEVRDQALLDSMDAWVERNKQNGHHHFVFAFDTDSSAREQIAADDILQSALRTTSKEGGADHG